MEYGFLSRAEVRAFDMHAIETLGIPGPILMENAGRGAAEILRGLGANGPVVIVCGHGNNGGDGFVMARHLANRQINVVCMTFAKLEDFSADALLHLKIVQKLGIPVHFFTDVTCRIQEITAVLADSDWIVDALFGTGLSGPVRTPMDRVIDLINASGKRVLAVDIPSGLDCDTGEPLGATIRAQHTVTFVAPKLGFRNPESEQFTGHVHVVDIGVGTQFGPLPAK
jgi:hydroxyethylthiazole kinase-like uncharacterized protein yjeF